MGCISSKQASSAPPASDEEDVGPRKRSLIKGSHREKVSPKEKAVAVAGAVREGGNGGGVVEERGEYERNYNVYDNDDVNYNNNVDGVNNKKLKTSKSKGSTSNFSLSLRFGSVKNQVVAEQTAAGWPGWLSAVAGEAIQGWVPLQANGFEKLDKIGQGTYSSVFRAREHATGRIVALKKVRFDNYHPESVRFMSREITILRKLDHPNIMKLHGLITSRVSCSIYLVFEYMEHDLAGLLSCPEIEFSEAQIKCFMQQILYGLDYCHRRGVMHRDIKTSNILLNNEGVLKLADFGLANFISTRYKQPLTSRVVTLWYRPPELLLGSTNYGAYVDMWSTGCVFAELLIRKPILKGKTEVEQLHKIFKLCGSPPEEFWTKSKLPHATMFKPQAPYESSLRDRFKSYPEHTLTLLETLLSIEPQDRGTAASSLNSTYFNTMPYACDPSSLPKYPPNKEMDAKTREEARRRRTGRAQDSTASSRMHRRRKGLPEPSSVSMLGRPGQEEPQVNRRHARRNGTNALVAQARKADDEMSIDMKSDVSHVTNASQDTLFAGGNRKSAALALAKRRIDEAKRSSSKDQSSSLDPSSVLHAHSMLDGQADVQEDKENVPVDSGGNNSNESRHVSQKQKLQSHQSASVEESDSQNHPNGSDYRSQEELASPRSDTEQKNHEEQ